MFKFVYFYDLSWTPQKKQLECNQNFTPRTRLGGGKKVSVVLYRVKEQSKASEAFKKTELFMKMTAGSDG